jgi:hypothetical protein
MREDPIISGAWIKAALVILAAGALGVGAYVLASGVHLNLPDLPDVGTSSDATTLSDTTLEDTTIGEPPTTTSTPQTAPSIQDLQELGRCTRAANGDIDAIQKCFDRFNRGRS